MIDDETSNCCRSYTIILTETQTSLSAMKTTRRTQEVNDVMSASCMEMSRRHGGIWRHVASKCSRHRGITRWPAELGRNQSDNWPRLTLSAYHWPYVIGLVVVMCRSLYIGATHHSLGSALRSRIISTNACFISFLEHCAKSFSTQNGKNCMILISCL